jgi:hypothetical protein
MAPVTVQGSRAIPVSVEEAFRCTVPIPLPVLFQRWHGPIPPIKDVRGQTGEWGTAGQTGTEVTWRWTIHPRRGLLRPVVVVIGRLWHGYARKALAELANQLLR